MARSFGGLWKQIVAWPNLQLAYHRCRRRKRYRPAALQFDFQWEDNLVLLQQELASGTWQPGPYHNFRIRDPKPRLISAAPFRDRIVHHAVVNVLEPLYERRFTPDSYACRKGRGTHRAWRRAQQLLRKYPYYLKTDLVKFFPNVDHEVLLTMLRRRLREAPLRELIRRIVASGAGLLDREASRHWFPGDDLFAVLRPKGLPIGNLTSQFFANVLLDPIDHLVREAWHVPGYVRYADDLVLFADSKAALWHWRDALRDALIPLRLRLHPDKTIVAPSVDGLNFLGLRLFPEGRWLQQRTIRRFVRRRRALQRGYEAGELRGHQIEQSLVAWRAFARDANSRGLCRDLWKQVVFRRFGKRPRRRKPGPHPPAPTES
jgi:RNA-directed DNA polymerase